MVSPTVLSEQETTQSTPDNPLSNIELPEIQFNPERKEAPKAYGKEEEAIDLLNKIIQESTSSNLSVEDWDQVKKAKNILNDLQDL